MTFETKKKIKNDYLIFYYGEVSIVLKNEWASRKSLGSRLVYFDDVNERILIG